MSCTIIEAENISHRYGPIRALDGFSARLDGGITALLGPNGAGKTTLIELILGIRAIQTGAIEVLGGAPSDPLVRHRIGAMLQISGVPGTLTVNELLGWFASFYPQPRHLDEVRELAGLSGLSDRRFDRLSGGQKQRLLFALALIGQPQLLVLDEPTTGLDPSARRGLWQAIRNHADEGGAVLLCTHYLDEADRLADRVLVINQGRLLISGTPEDIRRQVPNKRIRCRTRLAKGELTSFDDVISVQVDQDRVELLTADAEAVTARLLAADPALEGLEITGADLETAFLHLTDTKDLAA